MGIKHREVERIFKYKGSSFDARGTVESLYKDIQQRQFPRSHGVIKAMARDRQEQAQRIIQDRSPDYNSPHKVKRYIARSDEVARVNEANKISKENPGWSWGQSYDEAMRIRAEKEQQAKEKGSK